MFVVNTESHADGWQNCSYIRSRPWIKLFSCLALTLIFCACGPSDRSILRSYAQDIKEAQEQIRQEREPARLKRINEVISATPSAWRLCLSSDGADSMVVSPEDNDWATVQGLIAVYAVYDYFNSTDGYNNERGVTLWCVDFPGVRVSHPSEAPSDPAAINAFWQGTVVELVGVAKGSGDGQRLWEVRFVDDPAGQAQNILYQYPQLRSVLPTGIGLQVTEVEEYKVRVR